MFQEFRLHIASEPELHKLELQVTESYSTVQILTYTVSVTVEGMVYVDLLNTLSIKHNYSPAEMDDSYKSVFCPCYELKLFM